MTASLETRPARWLCGQLIVGGFDGAELPSAYAAALAAGERGGAILFRRNLPSLEATRSLIAAIHGAAPRDAPPWVGVDQEGGRVARLPKPFPTLVSMRALAERGADEIRRAAREVGEGLKDLGFNLNFAPVLDVDSNPDNPVIGDRSFGRDPGQVAALGVAFARGLEDAGVVACGKHFPGHGDTSVDSHFALPRVGHDRARMQEVEWPPFARAIEAGIPALMTAHILCEPIDPDRIATLSPVLCGILRHELGFRGVLFSDDLEMKAVVEVCRSGGSEVQGIARAAVLAVRAGCDVVLICSDGAAQGAALEALTDEAQRDEHFRARVIEAVARGLEVRRRYTSTGAASTGAAR